MCQVVSTFSHGICLRTVDGLEGRLVQEFLKEFLGIPCELEIFLRTYGYFAVLLLTFLEGETVIILASMAAAQGLMNPFLVGLCGFVGSFLGDQLYYTIGRYYGQPLLDRWPSLMPKIEWVFRLVRRYQDLYVLSFRFIYGVRNVSPFVIAISGVTRWRFMTLNGISALLWAITFTSGGYFFGYALRSILGTYQNLALIGLASIAVMGSSVVVLIRRQTRKKQRRRTIDTSRVKQRTEPTY